MSRSSTCMALVYKDLVVCRYILIGSAISLQVLKPFSFALCLAARVIAFLISSVLDRVREFLVPGRMEVSFLRYLMVVPSFLLLRLPLSEVIVDAVLINSPRRNDLTGCIK